MFARKFTVVTPIFNGSPWLELCIRSVHDQEGIEVEHLIQDGGSTDGTVENYSQDARVHFVSEPDQGMYDAINRGFRRAQGDIILHLNGDEQLLPGTLKRVAHFFDQNPLVEMCFAYALVLDTRGELLCYRKTLLPGRIHTCLSHLCTLTCATFYRRSALEEFGLYFDPSFRVLGDAELICKHLEFLDTPASNVVAFRINGKPGGDEWENITVVLNARTEPVKINLPAGKYRVVCRDGMIDIRSGLGMIIGEQLIVSPRSALIVHQ